MGNTQKNLMAAFAGESQANRKYLAFAKQAEKDGKPGIARLFRAAAEGETVHALNHLVAAGEVKTTKENLEAAIQGETYEIDEMYPKFLENAKTEGENKAVTTMGGALAVEKIHQQHYQEAMSVLEQGGDIELKEYEICPICGNLFSGIVPDVCPICGARRETFMKVA